MKNGLKISLLTLAILSNQAIKPMRITRTIETATNAFNKRVQEYEREAVKEPLKDSDYTKFKADINAIINSLRPFKEPSAIAKIAAFEKKLKDIETARTQKLAAEKIRNDINILKAQMDKDFKENFIDKNIERLPDGPAREVILNYFSIGNYADQITGIEAYIQQQKEKEPTKEHTTLINIDIPSARTKLGEIQQKYLAHSLNRIAQTLKENIYIIEDNIKVAQPDWSKILKPLSVTDVFNIGINPSKETYQAAQKLKNSKETKTLNEAAQNFAEIMERLLTTKNKFLINNTISLDSRLGLAYRDIEQFIAEELDTISDEFSIHPGITRNIPTIIKQNLEEGQKLVTASSALKTGQPSTLPTGQLTAPPTLITQQPGKPKESQDQPAQKQQTQPLFSTTFTFGQSPAFQPQAPAFQPQTKAQLFTKILPMPLLEFITNLEELDETLLDFSTQLKQEKKTQGINFKLLEQIVATLNDINTLQVGDQLLKQIESSSPEYNTIPDRSNQIIKTALAIIDLAIKHTNGLDQSIATNEYKTKILMKCNEIFDLAKQIAHKFEQMLIVMNHAKKDIYKTTNKLSIDTTNAQIKQFNDSISTMVITTAPTVKMEKIEVFPKKVMAGETLIEEDVIEVLNELKKYSDWIQKEWNPLSANPQLLQPKMATAKDTLEFIQPFSQNLEKVVNLPSINPDVAGKKDGNTYQRMTAQIAPYQYLLNYSTFLLDEILGNIKSENLNEAIANELGKIYDYITAIIRKQITLYQQTNDLTRSKTLEDRLIANPHINRGKRIEELQKQAWEAEKKVATTTTKPEIISLKVPIPQERTLPSNIKNILNTLIKHKDDLAPYYDAISKTQDTNVIKTNFGMLKIVAKVVSDLFRNNVDDINSALNNLEKTSSDYQDYITINPLESIIQHFNASLALSGKLLDKQSETKQTLIDIYNNSYSIMQLLSQSYEAIGEKKLKESIDQKIKLMKEHVITRLNDIPDPIK